MSWTNRGRDECETGRLTGRGPPHNELESEGGDALTAEVHEPLALRKGSDRKRNEPPLTTFTASTTRDGPQRCRAPDADGPSPKASRPLQSRTRNPGMTLPGQIRRSL